MELKRKIQIGVVVALVTLVVLAYLGTAPWKLSEGEQPIHRRSRWIEVPGEPIVMEDYAAEGQTVTLPFDFDEPYVSRITLFLIWEDDARTEADTLLYTLMDGNDTQVLSGGGTSGYVFMTNPNLGNNEVRHIENNLGWSVDVMCQEAKDGYIWPGGFITIPDDGQYFTVRIEWEHFIEHDPDWQ